MTFWAQLTAGNRKTVDVQVTYGPIHITVTEDRGHLKTFHDELGKLLETAEVNE